MRRWRPIGVAKREMRRVRRKTLEFRHRSQLRQRGGKAVRQQAQRHGLARAHAQPVLPVEVHFAVAAETAGAHIDRLDHGAPGADQGALAADDRPPAGDHRDVGGGTAHVRDDEIVQAREETRADDARRRPRQNGLHRILERNLRLHQRAVAFHDHQRRVDGLLRQHLRQGLDQMPDLRREACVQRGRQRAPRGIELRTQFVRAGHGLRRQCANQLARAQLMRRIAHGKIGRDGKCLDPRLVLGDRARHGGLVERRGLLAGRHMAALHPNHQAAAAGALQARTLDHGVVETDQQSAHRAEAIFDDGIRGESRRHGHQTDLLAAASRREAAPAPRVWPCRCRWPDSRESSAPWRSR